MSHFANDIPENAQELSLLQCGCREDCDTLSLMVRNAIIVPNPEKPGELMCKAMIPIHRIPALVAAMMTHYAKNVVIMEDPI